MKKEFKSTIFSKKEREKPRFSEYFLLSINFDCLAEKLIRANPQMPLRVAKAITLATIYKLHADLVTQECRKEEGFEDIVDEDFLCDENQ